MIRPLYTNALRTSAAALAVSAVLSACAGPAMLSQAETPGPEAVTAPGAFEPEKALALLNRFRAENGLMPLKLEPRATQAAASLAKFMAKNDVMSHIGPGGNHVGDRLKEAGYSWRLVGENIGAGQATVEKIIADWQGSPPHRMNMLLPDAKHAGIAMETRLDGKYRTYWALVLGAP